MNGLKDINLNQSKKSLSLLLFKKVEQNFA